MQFVVLEKAKQGPPWIGVDFDGTLAEHPKGEFKEKDLKPIGPMVSRVKRWLKDGKDVHILTARASRESFSKKKVKKQTKIIQKWCKRYLGRKLPVTAEKNQALAAIYDNIAYHVVKDTGRVVR